MLDEHSVLAGLLLCLLSVPAFLGSLELGHFWIGWILGLALVGYGNRLARREQDGARPPLLARIGRELAHVVCGLLLLVMVMLPLSIGELSLSRWSANEAAAVGRLRSLAGERRSPGEEEVARGYRFRVARGASASVVLASPLVPALPDRLSLRATGRRSFCLEPGGRICQKQVGERFEAKDGRCDELCTEVK